MAQPALRGAWSASSNGLALDMAPSPAASQPHFQRHGLRPDMADIGQIDCVAAALSGRRYPPACTHTPVTSAATDRCTATPRRAAPVSLLSTDRPCGTQDTAAQRRRRYNPAPPTPEPPARAGAHDHQIKRVLRKSRRCGPAQHEQHGPRNSVARP